MPMVYCFILDCMSQFYHLCEWLRFYVVLFLININALRPAKNIVARSQPIKGQTIYMCAPAECTNRVLEFALAWKGANAITADDLSACAQALNISYSNEYTMMNVFMVGSGPIGPEHKMVVVRLGATEFTSHLVTNALGARARSYPMGSVDVEYMVRQAFPRNPIANATGRLV